MNILVFSWRDTKHPLAGGAEQVDHEHHKGWIEAGHVVTLFTSFFPGGKKEEIIDGVKVIRRGSQYVTCHIWAFLWYVFGKHENFGVVVDEFHGWPFFTPLYVRKAKLAVIQELTREVWFKYPLPLRLNYILGTLGYLLEPQFFLVYRNVPYMTGSRSAKSELKTVGIRSQNVTVVPHGVILNLPKKLPDKEKKRTVIFLGAIARDKGIEDAIRTFGILGKTGDYQFWVVGKGDPHYMEYLKILAEKEGIEVSFFGFVSEEKKFDLLARAHVMINPSVREGWGLVNIEANSVGTPVVAYNSSGLVDSVRSGISGIIVDENTPSMLAKTVREILDDEGKYKSMQKSAVKWSKNFNWKWSRQKSLKLLESVFRGESD